MITIENLENHKKICCSVVLGEARIMSSSAASLSETGSASVESFSLQQAAVLLSFTGT